MVNKKAKFLCLTLVVIMCLSMFVGVLVPKKQVSAATVSGTTITSFGTYNSKALSWDIIGYVQTNGSIGSTKTNTALILCSNIIDCMIFDADSSDWTTSDIHTWLNGTFLNSFTTADKTAILKATTQTADSATSYTADASGDSCFLLSQTDVYTNNLLGSSNDDRIRNCNFTDLDKEITDNSAGWWWLRSPESANYVKLVGKNGSSDGDNYDDDEGGVVPAIFVDLTKLGSSSGDSGNSGDASTGVELNVALSAMSLVMLAGISVIVFKNKKTSVR